MMKTALHLSAPASIASLWLRDCCIAKDATPSSHHSQLCGMALTRLLLLGLLSASAARVEAAVALVGNESPCNATASDCPCGSAPPTWPPFGAAGWCPYGCLNAEGAADTTGDLAVDVNGVCASAAFAAWRAPATHDALAVAGCPLSAAPLVSLLFFKPCVNITALLAGPANGSCTPCALPPAAPSPPPPSPPPLPPPDAPLGAVEVVETTLCLVRPHPSCRRE